MALKSTGATTGNEPEAVPGTENRVSEPHACGRLAAVLVEKGVLVSNVIAVRTPAVTTERRASSV